MMKDVTADGAAPQYTGWDPLSAGHRLTELACGPAAAPRKGHDPGKEGACVVTPYYEDDYCTIYHGDAFELAPLLAAQVDAVVTDPPYGVGLEYGEAVDDSPELVDRIASELVPALTAACPVVLVTPGIRNVYRYPEPRHIGAWVHAPGGNGSSGPWGFNGWQPILFYGKCPYLSAGKGRRPDLLVHNMAGFLHARLERAAGGHPCPKPDSISKWLIVRATPEEGMTVLDPFMGSGSFLAAAKYSGRKAIGIEIEERYCEIAARRLAQEVLPL